MRSLLAILATAFVLASVNLQAADNNQKFSLSIESQELAAALQEFASQTGLQIVYFAKIAENAKPTHRLNGEFSAEQALDQLLDGTDLVYSSIDENTYSISRRGSDNAGNSEGTGVPASMADPLMAPGSRTGNQTLAQNDASATKSGSTASSVSNTPLPNVIEEITVSAQRREQQQKDVPASLTAFDGQFLDTTGTNTFFDIASITPGFSATIFSNSQPTYIMRGISRTLKQAGVNQPIGLFIDDVYIGRHSGSAFDLFDLKQVTILRGPQGTLFGRNVAAGAILVETAKPSLDQSTIKAEIGGGNYNAVDVQGMVTGPLSDKWAAKLAFTRKVRDGFGRDRLLDRELDNLDSLNFRGQLLYAPSQSTEFLFSMDYADDSNNGRTQSARTVNGSTSSLDPSYISTAVDDGNRRTAEQGAPVGVDPNFFDRQIWGTSLHANFDFDAGTFKSITAYREVDATEQFNLIGGNYQYILVPFLRQDFRTDTDKPKTFTQEFRFVGRNYVVGMFYLNEDTDRIARRKDFDNTGTNSGTNNVYNTNVKTNAFAVYGDLEFDIWNSVTANIGARYSLERKEAHVDFTNVLSPASDYILDDSHTWDHFTGRAAITWAVTNELNFYANIASGFSAGGFGTEPAFPTDFKPFDAETVFNTEIGAKGRWLGGRVAADLAFYRQRYDNMLQFIFNFSTLNGNVANCCDAVSKGVEADLAWRLTDNLGLKFTYALEDSEVVALSDLVAATPATGIFVGNSLGVQPKYTYSASMDYRRQLGESGEIFVLADWSKSSHTEGGVSNTALNIVPAYQVVNATVGYRTADDKWKFQLWARNLTDEDYVLIRGQTLILSETLGAPRTYGFRVTYSH